MKRSRLGILAGDLIAQDTAPIDPAGHAGPILHEKSSARGFPWRAGSACDWPLKTWDVLCGQKQLMSYPHYRDECFTQSKYHEVALVGERARC